MNNDRESCDTGLYFKSVTIVLMQKVLKPIFSIIANNTSFDQECLRTHDWMLVVCSIWESYESFTTKPQHQNLLWWSLSNESFDWIWSRLCISHLHVNPKHYSKFVYLIFNTKWQTHTMWFNSSNIFFHSLTGLFNMINDCVRSKCHRFVIMDTEKNLLWTES